MATTKTPPRPSQKDWPCIHRPKGVETRPLVRSILAAQGLTVITDMPETSSYWAIVKGQSPDAAPYALLCQTDRGRSPRDMHYLIVTEQFGFPEIPPRHFFSRILANCPVPPSDIAASRRARAVDLGQAARQVHRLEACLYRRGPQDCRHSSRRLARRNLLRVAGRRSSLITQQASAQAEGVPAGTTGR